MKTTSLLILLLLSVGLQAQPNFITNVDNRTNTSLGGKWKYIIDQYSTGAIGFSPLYENKKPTDKTDRVEYSFDQAQSLWVPVRGTRKKMNCTITKEACGFEKPLITNPS